MPRPPLLRSSLLSLTELPGQGASSLQEQTKGRCPKPEGPAHGKAGSCPQSLPALRKGGACSDVGMPSAHKQSLGRATQTQPSCSLMGEATLGSHSLAQMHRVGRRDISTLARGARKGEEHLSQHCLEGGAWPALGHLPLGSVSSGVWTKLIPRPSSSTCQSHPVCGLSPSGTQDKPFLS